MFDCFGAGQKVSRHTFAGRSWRDNPDIRAAMFAVFPAMRRLHEMLWYLDEAITLVEPSRDPSAWSTAFERIRELSDRSADELATLDVDAEYDAVRKLLVEASEIARTGIHPATDRRRHHRLRPGSDLMGARLARADLRGMSLRGGILVAADLSKARLGRCDVLGADMRDADLAGADLAGAIFLTQTQVDSARGDQRTVLPDSVDRPAHWSPGVRRRQSPGQPRVDSPRGQA